MCAERFLVKKSYFAIGDAAEVSVRTTRAELSTFGLTVYFYVKSDSEEDYF